MANQKEEANLDDALREVGSVIFLHREKAGDWRTKVSDFHLAHALKHIGAHLEGLTDEPHLAHAATRVLMALQLESEEAAK